MTGYVALSLWITLFLTAYGAIFLLIAKKTGKDYFKTAGSILIFAFVYFALAHFSLLNAAGLAIEESYEPECDYLLNNTFIDYTYGNNFTSYHWDYSAGSYPTCQNPNDPACAWVFHTNTTYTYMDTCADGAPKAATTLFTIFTWLLWIDAIAVFLGTFTLLIKWMGRRFV